MSFNPDPNKPYGHAVDDGTVFQTESEAQEYMSANLGKSVKVTNPPRSRRVTSEVSMEVSRALERVWEKFADQVMAGNLTVGEITGALWGFDLESEWLDAADEMELEGDQA